VIADPQLAIENGFSRHVKKKGRPKMSRRLVFCLAALALLSSYAHPINAQGIFQHEDYGIGAGNLLTLSGGFGMVGDTKIAAVSLDQASIKPGGLWAIQSDDAIFTQRAGAVGLGSTLGVWQIGSASGGQFQFVAGWAGTKIEGQRLNVDLSQGLAQSGGMGAAAASQQFIGGSLQMAGSPTGSMSESRLINVGQDAALLGVSISGVVVAGGISVETRQIQADIEPSAE
jgi:hypothetical protein